jgi:hypothetical protein
VGEAEGELTDRELVEALRKVEDKLSDDVRSFLKLMGELTDRNRPITSRAREVLLMLHSKYCRSS